MMVSEHATAQRNCVMSARCSIRNNGARIHPSSPPENRNSKSTLMQQTREQMARRAHATKKYLQLLFHSRTSVERVSFGVHRGLSPLRRAEAVASPGGDGSVQPRDAEVRVRQRRAVPLHVDEPWRRVVLSDAQRLQRAREHEERKDGQSPNDSLRSSVCTYVDGRQAN